MAAPATTSEFLELVRKSGVVEEKPLDAHLQKLRAAGPLPAEAAKLAGILVRDGLLTHFQAEQILQGKWRRFTIGKYKVLETLGSGGMGSVYLCEHKLMRRRVAVKILPPSKAGEQAVLERFYREARAAAALDHPNIVHAYDIDQDDKLHFLVMEYVDGSSLQEIVKKTGPMDIGRAAHYIRQASIGLDHAHGAGLVHRDIKPGNILVDRSGVVKVLDMGLARFFNDEDDVLTRKHDENVLGTADYLAPEQAIDSHSVDIRADIYSMGATFYFLLTASTPFGEGTVAQKLLWHQSRQPKAVSAIRKDVPPALAAIIEKMMAKEKSARFQTPAEVVEALTTWTQRSIGPPPELEMPRLSPAATGVTPAETTVVSANPPGGAAAPKAWQITTPPPGAAKPVTPAPASAALAPPLQLAETSAQVADAEPVPEEVAWENLTSDTEDPSARAATAPNSKRRVRRANEALARAKERRKLRRIFLVVTALGLVVLAAFVWLFYFSPQAGFNARPHLFISKNAAGKSRHYASIIRALDDAQSGDIIEILDEVHEENLVIDPNNNQTTRVTIQAAPGVNVVWKARYKNEFRPLVVLNKAHKLVLKGITFDGAIDGKRKVRDLIHVSFESPGLVLENLDFKNFAQTAVTIVNCQGEPDRPVRLKNLRAAGPSPDPARSPFYFTANPQVRPNQNDYIEIEEIDPVLLRKKDNSVNGPNINGWPEGS